MELNILVLSLLIAMSLVMGMFSVTQLGYQKRVGGAKMFVKSIWTFLRGFFCWPFLLPIGLMNGTYKMNVFHKVGNTKFD